MVKGINKQVIVVKAPDPRLFEEAIFILREGALAEGASPEQVLKEARQAAKSYVSRSTIPEFTSTAIVETTSGSWLSHSSVRLDNVFFIFSRQ